MIGFIIFIVLIATAIVLIDKNRLQWAYLGIKAIISHGWIKFLTRFDNAKLSDNSKYLTIIYQYNGTCYLVHVPFNTKLRVKAINNPVCAHSGSLISKPFARCHPCVPILVTPSMMNVESITIGNAKFEGDSLPNFNGVD